MGRLFMDFWDSVAILYLILKVQISRKRQSLDTLLMREFLVEGIERIYLVKISNSWELQCLKMTKKVINPA